MPEMIVLRRVREPKLLAALIDVVGVGVLIVGHFFNWILQLLTKYLSPNSKEALP